MAAAMTSPANGSRRGEPTRHWSARSEPAPTKTSMLPMGLPVSPCCALGGDSNPEFNPLRQWQRIGPVDRVRLTAHVGLPGVRAGLAAAAGLFLAAEGAADFGARRADVHVGDAAIGSAGREESLRRSE